MRERKGFTLIELLVVVAIIGLLLAIIIPALRKAKETAWNVICRNNLRQYGVAGQIYMQDSDGLFPNAWGCIFKSVGPNRLCQWHDQSKNPLKRPELAGSLWNYLGAQDKSHSCPLFERFALQNHICPANIPVEPVYSYSMNAFLGGFELAGSDTDVAQYPHVLQVKQNQIRSPASIFFFGEQNPWVNEARYLTALNDTALCGGPRLPANPAAWSLDPSSIVSNSNRNGLRYINCFASFHKTTLDKKDEGESNVVFVDGHVEMTNWENTYKMSRWTKKAPPLHN